MLKLMVADDEIIERKVLEKMIRQGCCQVEVICGAENGIEMSYPHLNVHLDK